MTAPSSGGDFFALFGLPKTFDLDGEDLSRRYRALQAAAHPDRFAGKSTAEKQAALTAASRINDAYRALKDPLSRAAYMLSLSGVEVFAETGAPMSADFLAQQMEWREKLEELQANGGDSNSLRAEVMEAKQSAAADAADLLSAALSADGKQQLADTIRRWHYLQKLLAQIQ